MATRTAWNAAAFAAMRAGNTGTSLPWMGLQPTDPQAVGPCVVRRR